MKLVEIADPGQDAMEALDDLRSLATLEKPSALLPLDDYALWLCDRAGVESSTLLAGPTGKQAVFALDKRRQIEAAGDAGFLVPPSQYLTSPDQVDGPYTFPVVAKPAMAVWYDGLRLKRGAARICADAAELGEELRNLDAACPMLVQPFLIGVGEGLVGVADSSGLVRVSAHRRVRMMNPEGSGSSACSAITVDDGIATAAERMLLDVGWRGMFMVELLRDHAGRAWFMELNGRAWGSMALSRRMGLEYPGWAVALLLDPGFELPAVVPPEFVTCRHLGRELVHLLFVLRGPRSAHAGSWPSRLHAFHEVVRVSQDDRWYNWRQGEAVFFLDDSLQTVLDHVSRRRRTS